MAYFMGSADKFIFRFKLYSISLSGGMHKAVRVIANLLDRFLYFNRPRLHGFKYHYEKEFWIFHVFISLSQKLVSISGIPRICSDLINHNCGTLSNAFFYNQSRLRYIGRLFVASRP